MLFYTVGQSQVFLAMVYAGLFVGALYDVMRLVRTFLTAGPVLTLAADLVFGAGSAALLIAFMYKANYLDLRLYLLLGAVCGLLLYEFTLGPLLWFLFGHAGRFLGRVVRKIVETKLLKRILR